MDAIAQNFQVAQASGGDWEDLTTNCLAELGPLPASANIGFVYVTDSLDEDLRSILKRLRAETRIHNWVGTIGFGICVSRTELFDMPAMAIMADRGESEPPCTVTARYTVKLRRPTPLGVPLHITSQIESIDGDRANVTMELTADGEVCARGEGLFVAVKEGHPAWHRWH